MLRYLSDKEELDRVSNGLYTRSNGILRGAIGALDGWLVKIIRPSWKKDVATFFTRKVFYALNVQCLVYHNKS